MWLSDDLLPWQGDRSARHPTCARCRALATLRSSHRRRTRPASPTRHADEARGKLHKAQNVSQGRSVATPAGALDSHARMRKHATGALNRQRHQPVNRAGITVNREPGKRGKVTKHVHQAFKTSASDGDNRRKSLIGCHVNSPVTLKIRRSIRDRQPDSFAVIDLHHKIMPAWH